MTTDRLITYLENLRNDVDPATSEVFDRRDSCLSDPEVRKALNRFIRFLVSPPKVVTPDIPDEVIAEACGELRSLGYNPSVMQLAKVFIASRSIVDRNLKALTSYGRYRNVFTRKAIHAHLTTYSRANPTILAEVPRRIDRTVDEPWRVIDFFRTEPFDKLDDAKEDELRKAVCALGLRKPDDVLPAYMVSARQKYPRSYEPWVRDEQALVIEAMCYTNDAERLGDIFGRSANALEKMGQRLIWDSREKRA